MYSLKLRIPAEWYALMDLAYADDPVGYIGELDLPDFWTLDEFKIIKGDSYAIFDIDGMPTQEDENAVFDELESANSFLYSEYYL